MDFQGSLPKSSLRELFQHRPQRRCLGHLYMTKCDSLLPRPPAEPVPWFSDAFFVPEQVRCPKLPGWHIGNIMEHPCSEFPQFHPIPISWNAMRSMSLMSWEYSGYPLLRDSGNDHWRQRFFDPTWSSNATELLQPIAGTVWYCKWYRGNLMIWHDLTIFYTNHSPLAILVVGSNPLLWQDGTSLPYLVGEVLALDMAPGGLPCVTCYVHYRMTNHRETHIFRNRRGDTMQNITRRQDSTATMQTHCETTGNASEMRGM